MQCAPSQVQPDPTGSSGAGIAPEFCHIGVKESSLLYLVPDGYWLWAAPGEVWVASPSMQGRFWSAKGELLEKGAAVSHNSQQSQQLGIGTLTVFPTGVAPFPSRQPPIRPTSFQAKK